MSVKKQQFWKAKQSTSKPKTSVDKTRDTGHTTASGHDVRSDNFKVSSLVSSVSTEKVAGFECESAGVKYQQYQTRQLSIVLKEIFF
ncbi:MAG: hypothetical protein V1492_05815 [Candidatus Micrarchaeota archaeon]